MKRSSFIALFLTTNFAFVLLHLHKQSKLIKLSYEKQKIESEIAQITKQKQELTHQLHTMHDRSAVKHYVIKNLNTQDKKLEHIKISQIKKVEF